MRLLIRGGPDAGQSFDLGAERVIIGRSEECDLRLPDDNASRRHAAIEPLPDGRVLLRDLGSANGTFVDGRRVVEATLEGGEQLQFGDSLMFVEREGRGPETVINAPARAVGPTESQVIRAVVGGSALRRAVRSDSVIRQALAAPQRARRTALATTLGVVAAVLGIFFAVGILPPEQGASTADVVEETAPATALVEVLDAAGARTATGTGWVLDAEERLVVTNAHVVNQGLRFRVAVGGRSRPATVVSAAPCEDLAVLRLPEGGGRLQAIALGSQATLRRGETVVAVGYPGNASLQDQLTSTEGIVSVVRTSYREPAPDVPAYPNVIQTDAALNPGNSGGPLVDLEGRLVGVNSAGRTSSEEGRVIQGQGYAIGVDRAKQVLAQLRGGQSQAWPGFAFGYPTADVLEEQRLPPGLFIQNVRPGTPAAAAGLDEGQFLVVGVNGRAVESTLASWCAAAGDLRSGDEVRLEVVRPGSAGVRTVRFRLP